MISEFADVGPLIGLFCVSVAMTAASLWLAGRLAPWVTGEPMEAPTIRSFFLEPTADFEVSKGRLVTLGIAAAILLAMMLALAIAVKVG